MARFLFTKNLFNEKIGHDRLVTVTVTLTSAVEFPNLRIIRIDI
jgi:hypothetical protein